MWGKNRPSYKILVLSIAILLLAGLALPALGQDEEPTEEPSQESIQEPLPQVFITGNDITTPPNSIIHVYGRDLEGNAIDFTTDPLILKSGGAEIETTVSDTYPAGTFTVFLIDLPNSVEEQVPAIQDAIQQFAGPGGMQEQVDSIAIYQVGESSF